MLLDDRSRGLGRSSSRSRLIAISIATFSDDLLVMKVLVKANWRVIQEKHDVGPAWLIEEPRVLLADVNGGLGARTSPRSPGNWPASRDIIGTSSCEQEGSSEESMGTLFFSTVNREPRPTGII